MNSFYTSRPKSACVTDVYRVRLYETLYNNLSILSRQCTRVEYIYQADIAIVFWVYSSAWIRGTERACVRRCERGGEGHEGHEVEVTAGGEGKY